MAGKWKTVGSEVVLTNKWYSIRRDEVIRPDGQAGEYFVLQQADSIYLLAWHNNKVVFIRNFRYPTQVESWEIPAGLSEQDESVLDAAARELQEETGLVAENVKIIGTFQELSGRSTGMGHVVWCEALTETTDKQHDEEGIIEQAEFSKPEILAMIQSGEINDSGTLSSLAIALSQGLLETKG